MCDQHVENLDINDEADLVIIQVYITNAYRAYKIADHYRAKGSFVILGGLHVTSLPEEALPHADAIFWDLRRYISSIFETSEGRQTAKNIYICSKDITWYTACEKGFDQTGKVPGAQLARCFQGCPHHCDFCYKDAFLKEVGHFIPSWLTKPWQKLIGCRGDICIFWMIIYWATFAFPLPF